MNLNEYQSQAGQTRIYDWSVKQVEDPLFINILAYCALGLNGEAGEVAEQIKKAIRNDYGKILPDRKEKILLELGDVLWYIAALATELDETLETVAFKNIEKLKKRNSAT